MQHRLSYNSLAGCNEEFVLRLLLKEVAAKVARLTALGACWLVEYGLVVIAGFLCEEDLPVVVDVESLLASESSALLSLSLSSAVAAASGLGELFDVVAR